VADLRIERERGGKKQEKKKRAQGDVIGVLKMEKRKSLARGVERWWVGGRKPLGDFHQVRGGVKKSRENAHRKGGD